MSTQATTAAGTTPAVMTIHEYRIERTSAGWLRTLLASIRRDRAARDQWQWQPIQSRPANMQQEVILAQHRLLAR